MNFSSIRSMTCWGKLFPLLCDMMIPPWCHMNFTFTFSFLGLVKVKDTSTFLGFAYMQDLVLWFTAALWQSDCKERLPKGIASLLTGCLLQT